ncbi:MAG: radical SAM protein [Desulfobacteraceae bacterium]|nr:radical SAM protein [Desulfobacteraceae bacterium]
MILLINPPLVKPSEPPPGIARLAGALRYAGVPCTLIDANIEAILELLGKTPQSSDRWTLRSVRNRERNLSAIRTGTAFSDLQRYKRAVSDIDRLVQKSAEGPIRLSLSNYHDDHMSPLRSRDLLKAAGEYENNPFFPYFSKRIGDAVERDAPSILGLSLNYLSQALTAFAMAGFVRARFPGLRIVIGGGLATSWARKPGWQNPFAGLIDRIVDGPGECELLKLAGGHANGWTTPDYSTFPLGDYLSPGLVLPYSTSSGCYWNACAFCPEKAEKTPYEPIAPALAVREAGVLAGALRPSLLHFLDSALSPTLLRRLAENPPGAPWYGFARVTRSLADEDFCRALRRSGCVMLKLGLESGDQRVIDAEGKGIDLSVASRALVALKKAGIATYGYFLFGTPSESEPEARNTLEFVARHSGSIDFLNLAIFNMPVNSPDAERFGTSPHYEGDLALYTDFSHPRGWSRSRVRRFLHKEFRRHPAVAAVMVKDPPFFTSNHAPFFCMDRPR